MAFLLSLSRPSDAVKVPYPNPALEVEQARAVLRLRQDFTAEQVASLRLAPAASARA